MCKYIILDKNNITIFLFVVLISRGFNLVIGLIVEFFKEYRTVYITAYIMHHGVCNALFYRTSSAMLNFSFWAKLKITTYSHALFRELLMLLLLCLLIAPLCRAYYILLCAYAMKHNLENAFFYNKFRKIYTEFINVLP